MIDYVDLNGSWDLFLAEGDTAATPLSALKPKWNDTMELPGTTSLAGKGPKNEDAPEGFLTDPFKFEGTAWLRKIILLPDMSGKRIRLFMERTRVTAVYFDRHFLGVQDSLVAPHIYDITRFASKGEHELIIAVSNIGYKTPGGHLTSQDTQTNWCGITGKLRLLIYGREIIDNVMIYPNAAEGTLRVTGEVNTRGCGSVTLSADSLDPAEGEVGKSRPYKIRDGRFDLVYRLDVKPRLWSDESPALYRLNILAGNDFESFTFGFRDFKAEWDKFTLNGRRIFLRGKHDGMIFPLTGFAPTETSEWERVMSIAKSYGINHYRFHTCCPPEAAFEAADRLGIIMEPELPFWGTVREEGEPEYNGEEQDFLVSEGMRMLECFGNHPSFCMLSLGNELWGSQKKLNAFIRQFRSFDPRRLYTQGSNNFQWYPAVLEEDDFFVGVRLSKNRLLRGSYAMCDAPQGHIQTEKPSTVHDYDSAVSPDAAESEGSEGGTVRIQFGTGVKTVEVSETEGGLRPEVPIITHETGQYETFPNFEEIKKYTGVLKPRNLIAFKKRLEERGLLPLAKDFFECSGRLAAQCYKEELESAFRSKKLAGFQLLDLQDFTGQGTALVGMLDAFMDSKGLVTPERWRQSCSDAVLLARFERYCFEAGEEFSARFELAYFRSAPIKGASAKWRLSGEGYFISGSAEVPEGENYFDLGLIRARLPFAKKPARLTLALSLDGTDIENSYELYVYPKIESVELSGVKIFRSICPEAEELLKAGETVLIIPETEGKEGYIDGTYCTDFWCYPMFSSISRSMGRPEPIGTMGLLIDNTHPMLAGFPCERWTTPQWWEIVTRSRSEILDGRAEGKRVIIRTIDNFERAHDLALAYEYDLYGGRVVVLNCELDALTETPEGRAFIKSVVDSMHNAQCTMHNAQCTIKKAGMSNKEE